jgi:AraC-like DNA-binding protein
LPGLKSKDRLFTTIFYNMPETTTQAIPILVFIVALVLNLSTAFKQHTGKSPTAFRHDNKF